MQSFDSRNKHQELITSAWEPIERSLESRKQQLYDQIKNYPTPITACDLQFNYLLEQQAATSQELSRMHKAFQESLAGGDAIEIIHKFVRSSSCFDDEAAAKIQSDLSVKLVKLKT